MREILEIGVESAVTFMLGGKIGKDGDCFNFLRNKKAMSMKNWLLKLATHLMALMAWRWVIVEKFKYLFEVGSQTSTK